MESESKYPIFKTIGKMLANVKRQNKALFAWLFVYTIAAAIYPFFGIVLPKLLIGELVLGDLADVKTVIIIIVGYLLLASMVGFIKSYTSNCAYPRITRLRIDYIGEIFDKIVSADYQFMEDSTFFDKNDRAMEATSSNSNGVEGVYHKLFDIPAVMISIIALIVLIGMINPLILLGLLVNLLVTIYISRKVHKQEYKRKEQLAKADRKKRYYYQTTHDFSYGKDIRLYGLAGRILSNYDKEINGYIAVKKQIFNREYALGFLGLFTLLLSDALTYGILIKKVVDGMSIADFSMYLAAVVSLSAMLKNFSEQISYVINETHYVYDFYNFLDRDLGAKGGKHKSIKDDTLEIEFDNVSFKYPNTDRYIIKDLNFKINKGERLAIVGINGAGKSTIVKLMIGLFDVTEGEIRINQIPIKQFDKKELYNMFAVVFQDINVLAFTVNENVACTSEEIDETRVIKSLDRVGLTEKINELPKGREQMMLKIIEADGTEFSGGQSQKLAIARALYKDSSMVIMDEPTAALDALAEAEIYENFSELVKGKTAVYISHRLASTKFCDKIALFDKDGLKEYGNHEELMKLGGSYSQMFSVQGKYYTEGRERREEDFSAMNDELSEVL
jgi:ABC-type multidrug transport system fused ATPase/permease subunit|nr:ABC transporter ATP-binding protein [uncultured Lachnoclostridium sp.]